MFPISWRAISRCHLEIEQLWEHENKELLQFRETRDTPPQCLVGTQSPEEVMRRGDSDLDPLRSLSRREIGQ
jgi:hypothetical protein